MSNRFVSLALCALALSACDLLVTRATPSSSPPFATFQTIGSVAPDGTGAGGAGLLKSADIFGGTSSPSPSPVTPSPSPSATPPPSFTPSAPPTTAAPSTAPTASPTPNRTASPSPTASVAAPVITGFQPEVGARGSILVINGRNLATTRLVLFGDIAVTPQRDPTDAQVVVVVPANAVTSRIGLVWTNGVVTSTQFFEVLEPTAPPTPCSLRTQCTPPPTP